jgi:hypothetical protein
MTQGSQVDIWEGRFKGRVRQTKYPSPVRDPAQGQVIHDGHNLIVDNALEVMIAALMGSETIQAVDFGYAGGKPVTRGLRSILSPVAYARTGEYVDTKPVASRDEAGIRSIGTWTAVLTPDTELVYDTLGLVTSSNAMIAATNFEAVTLAAGETIAVQWTILLRGP